MNHKSLFAQPVLRTPRQGGSTRDRPSRIHPDAAMEQQGDDDGHGSVDHLDLSLVEEHPATQQEPTFLASTTSGSKSGRRVDASFFDTEGQRRELPSQNSSAVDLGAQGAGSFSWLSPSRSVSVSPLPESALVGAGTPNPRGNLLQGVQFEGTPVVVVDDGEEETRGDSGEEADVEADDSHTAPLLRSNGEDQEPALGPKGSSVRRKRSWSKKRGEAAVDPRVAHTARGARKKRLAIRSHHRSLFWVLILFFVTLMAFCIAAFVLLEVFASQQSRDLQEWQTFGNCRNTLPLVGSRLIRYTSLSLQASSSPILPFLQRILLGNVTYLESTCLPFLNDIGTQAGEAVYKDIPEVTFSADGTNFPLREVRTRPMLNVLSSIITSSKAALSADLSTQDKVYTNADLAYAIRNSLNVGRVGLNPLAESLIFSEVEQNRKDRVTNLVAMSCMLVVVTVMYFLMVLPVFFLQRKRQASSLRLFLAVPRAVVIRQYRKYREAMTGSQGGRKETDSMQSILEENSAGTHSINRKFRNLRQNIPFVSLLLLLVAMVSFGLFFTCMNLSFETTTSLPKEQNLANSRQFLVYDMLGHVDIFNQVSRHRAFVTSASLDSSFAGLLVHAMGSLSEINTELSAAWNEYNDVEEQLRFARLNGERLTGDDAPRLVDEQENLLFSLRCDVENPNTNITDSECTFYSTEVINVLLNIKRFVSRDMSFQLATPTSQTPDEVANVYAWVSDASASLNSNLNSAADTFNRSRVAYETARSEEQELSQALNVSGFLIAMIGLTLVFALLVLPAYNTFQRKTSQLYRIFGFLPSQAIQQQELLFKFLYRGEQVSEEELNKTLTEGEQKVFTMLNKAGDGLVMIDEKAIITIVNDRLCEMSGWTREELVGNNVKMLVPPATRPFHDGYIASQVRNGNSQIMWSAVDVFLYKKGDVEKIPVKVSPSEGKVHGKKFFAAYVHDLTEEEEFSKSIQKNEQKLSSILEGWKDGLILTDRKCNIITVNPAMSTIFGFTKEEFLEMNVSQLCPSPHAELHDEYLEKYLRTGESDVIGTGRQIRARRKDGTEFPAFLNVVDGRVGSDEFFVGFVRDFTETEAELRRLQMIGSQWKGLFDFVEEGIVVTDDRANVIRMNQTAAFMLRVQNVSDFCQGGHNVREFVADTRQRQLHDSYVERFKREGVFTTKEDGVRGRVRRLDGSTATMLIRVQEFRMRNQRFFAAFLEDEGPLERQRSQLTSMLHQSSFLLRGVYPSSMLAAIAAARMEDTCVYQEHSFTTVLALDMVNFTRFSSQSSPEAMISMMSEIFDMFDAVAERHNVHRAKIIGDAYIAVAGLPPRTDVRALSEERQLQQSLSEGEESRHSSSSNVMLIPGGASQTGGEGSSEGGEAAFVRPPPLRRQNTASSLDPASSQANLTHLMNPLNQKHAINVMMFGMEIIQALDTFNVDKRSDLHIRVGIDSGSLVTACMGRARSFEVFGGVLDHATLLETTGKPDQLHVSEATYTMVSDLFPVATRVVSDSGVVSFLVQGLMEECSI
mgnify:CR=1 FL=1